MTRNIILFVFVGLLVFTGRLSAQEDTALMAGISRLFDTTKFKVDTTAPPNDSLTAKIRVLRAERGSFNIENVISLLIQEQRSTDTTHSKEYYDRLLEDCQHGAAHRLIENVFVNLYRQCFTSEEVDQLVNFYKTSAGKKTWRDFIILSITGASAAENIVKATAEKLSSEMKKEGTLKEGDARHEEDTKAKDRRRLHYRGPKSGAGQTQKASGNNQRSRADRRRRNQLWDALL